MLDEPGWFNAYDVLGLESGASSKEVTRRMRELESLIKIGVVPDYETDLPSSKELRTASNVKRAGERLTSKNKKIKEYFFWFSLRNARDKAGFRHIVAGEWGSAVEIWQEIIEKTPNNVDAWRNLALAATLAWQRKFTKKMLFVSLDAYSHVTCDDKIWRNFVRSYKALNPETSEELISDFRANAREELMELYETQAIDRKNAQILEMSLRKFGGKSKRFDEIVLSPNAILLEVFCDTAGKYQPETVDYGFIEVSSESLGILRKFVAESDRLIEAVSKYGDVVWGAGRILAARDKCADALRGLSVRTFNKIDSESDELGLDVAADLLNAAVNIAGTTGEITRLEEDVDKFNELWSQARLARAVSRYKEGSYQEAQKIISQALARNDISAEIRYELMRIGALCSAKIEESTESAKHVSNGVPTPQINRYGYREDAVNKLSSEIGDVLLGVLIVGLCIVMVAAFIAASIYK